MSPDRSLTRSVVPLMGAALAAGVVGAADAAYTQPPVESDGAIASPAENITESSPALAEDLEGLAQPEAIALDVSEASASAQPLVLSQVNHPSPASTMALVDENPSFGSLGTTLSWLMIVAGLCPLVATGTLWAMRRRVIQHLVQSVRDRLTELGELDRQVYRAQRRANQSIDGLEERVKQVRGEAQELIYQLQDEVENVRASAEQELTVFKAELKRRQHLAHQYADQFNSALDEDRVAIAQRIAELEHEFISDMQVLAGQAETNKAELLEEFIQNAPATLVEHLQPQIRDELKAIIKELKLAPNAKQSILTFPNQDPAAASFGTAPTNPVEEGERLVRAGQYDAALQQYEKALEQDSRCYEAWLGKGVTLEALQRYEAAIAAYDRAVNIKPNDYEGWYNRGLVLGRLGKYDDAMTSYGQALVIAPSNPNLWLHRGIILAKLSQYEAALEAYTQAVNLKPDSHEAWYNLANAQVRLQRNDEALTAYEQALEHNPRNTGAWHNRGIVLSKMGQFEGAIESYHAAIALDDQDPETWYSCGNALAHLGRYDEAIDAYDRAIALKPAHDRAQRNREVVMGQLAVIH